MASSTPKKDETSGGEQVRLSEPRALTGRPRSCECGECKKCRHRDYMRGWYARKSPEERSEYRKSRDQDLVRARDRERGRTERRRLRANATAAVWNAIRDGRLERGPCEVGVDCAGRVEGHHDDYSRQLDVRWLCKRHHDQLHLDMREAA